MKSIIHDWLYRRHTKVVRKWISSPVGFWDAERNSSTVSDWQVFKAFNLYSVDLKKAIRLNPRILFK